MVDEEPRPVASCYSCDEERRWRPASRRGYAGFACEVCDTFQEGGLMDVDGTWWENRDGTLRRKD